MVSAKAFPPTRLRIHLCMEVVNNSSCDSSAVGSTQQYDVRGQYLSAVPSRPNEKLVSNASQQPWLPNVFNHTNIAK